MAAKTYSKQNKAEGLDVSAVDDIVGKGKRDAIKKLYQYKRKERERVIFHPTVLFLRS